MERRKRTNVKRSSSKTESSSSKGATSAVSIPGQGIPVFDSTIQDHLFISYAWENCALADWLVRQLTLHGYRVWCDRFQMLGGESFPQTIDQAIKTRTFRMIALLSRHSLDKPNPRKERTLALNLGRQWAVDFMIPLNLDGLKPSELPWDYSDLTYIPFEDWAAGLEQLLRVLAKAGTPKPLTEAQGRQFAVESYLPQHVIINRQELLFTNCFEFERIPDRLYMMEWTAAEPWSDHRTDSAVWPYYLTSNNRIVSFSAMPPSVPSDHYVIVRDVSWRDTDMLEGIRSRDIVSNLLRQAFERTLEHRGLKRDFRNGLPFFPRGLLRKNKIVFTSARRRKTWVAVVGQKTLRGQPYRYHLVPDFQIRQDMGADFIAQLKIRVRITDMHGKLLKPLARAARRKHLAASWFNHHWLSRVLAISSYLAKRKDKIVLLQGSDPVVLFATAISGSVNASIDETALRDLRNEITANTPGWEEEEEQD